MSQNRRTFIQTTTSATAALLFSPLDIFATPYKSAIVNKNFELKILATNWGFHGTTDQFCSAAKKEGYDGIEIWWPNEVKDQQELFAALKKHSLDVGFLCGGWQPDFKEHFEFFRKVTIEAAMNNVQKPLYINCHSGRDHFSFEQNSEFVNHTTQLSKQSGITICHESHRSRIMFAAHVTRKFMEKFSELKLTFDVSHWCNVHESMLGDQKETVEMALQRTEHIHARIGHPEGPQVNDPRAPEWEEIVKQHFDWWDKVAERKKKNGERMTILTEFGPPDYMATLPYTRQPLADQWAINVHMMKLLRKRYEV
ncbi:sugar phosphate isomerase/epimerase family protein [Terrimonas alba]|uniref:sugar phosphate isomerase/epimerase family protein n=1 Tax=Terrimonas alba TaxID=3349636 RepID=UPI0035F489AF